MNELAFLSATLAREVAEDMAATHFGDGVLLRLLVPANLPGVGVVHRVPLEQALEWEVLLRRGLDSQVVERGAKMITVEVMVGNGAAAVGHTGKPTR